MAIDPAILSSIQRAHPEWRVVDAIPAPNGGIWAMGSDGGVFSLNAQGGTDGNVAPFFGSRGGSGGTYNRIVSDPATGGYTLISTQPGNDATFKGDRPIDQTQTSTLPAATPKPSFTDADLNQLTAFLNSQGLGDLVNQAWEYYKNPQGGAGDQAATLAYLETTDQFKQRFPGLDELKKQGRAWTPAQWNDYYNAAQQQALSAGLPQGYLDRADIGKLLAGNVSPAELQGRIQAAGQSVYNADPAVINRLRSWGLSDGDLAAFYLDPDRATPLIERKAQEAQARIAVAGSGAGYNLGREGAISLQKLGVDENAAIAGFGQLHRTHALFENLAGEEGDITTEEQLAATFGRDAAALAAQDEINRRRTGRAALFEGGGGAATGGGGRTGLG